jgi:hypothetical protein
MNRTIIIALALVFVVAACTQRAAPGASSSANVLYDDVEGKSYYLMISCEESLETNLGRPYEKMISFVLADGSPCIEFKDVPWDDSISYNEIEGGVISDDYHFNDSLSEFVFVENEYVYAAEAPEWEEGECVAE